ncbi:germination protein YpeB [Desulfotruncus alcoholivorax]|uniref:germination protein YpeB n=1 Tax=Desulfotruncus alcoholivorax TaxID=265477 RepID=UPI000424E0FF|nr:germination protein YpeB [Desulfotruncus alcoholivorax]
MIKKWMAIIGIAAFAAFGLGYWGYQQNQTKKMLQTALANNYQRAFYNAAYHVQNTEVLLGKSLVSAGVANNQRLFDQIWTESNQAMDNLTQLPVGDELLGRTVKFITQLGDYSRMLSQQVAGGKPVSPDQLGTLNNLYNQVSSLNKELGTIHAGIMDGKYTFSDLAVNGSRRLAREGSKLAGPNFQAIDRQMYGYPTLIYDGPFSDHLERAGARGVTGQEVNRDRARTIALNHYDNKGGENPIAQVTGTVESNIPAYRVEIARRKNGKVAGEPVVVDVSKKGGHLIWMLNPRSINNSSWTITKARSRAQSYLESHGYKNFKPSYYQTNDNAVTFNFALNQGGVIIYPDLVKVTVALDNGQVVGMDARGYLTSHYNRRLPRPKLNEMQARKLVSGSLKVEGSGRLALIPLDANREKLTWEFKGTLGGDSYLVYINAIDGKEEKVLRLLDTNNGLLTM